MPFPAGTARARIRSSKPRADKTRQVIEQRPVVLDEIVAQICGRQSIAAESSETPKETCAKNAISARCGWR